MPEQKQLDIRIHTPENNSTSSEDADRLEMPWEQREEQYYSDLVQNPRGCEQKC